MVGLPLSFFLVCVPKKSNFSISFFEVSKKGVEIHRNSGMEMEKKRSSSSFGNGSKILGARRRGDPYHLDLVLLPLFFFFNNNESVLLLPVSNRAC